jgi:AraC-like DNA-binding protein/DNA gyrase inhibitor GyrI
MVKKAHQSQFHRSQIGRAQRYIRLHLAEPMSLSRIAREACSSSYHFARLFHAYTAETPFEFLRRLRLVTALRMLEEDPRASVTEIALCVGYEASAALNKFFRKALDMNPGDFRKLGKERQHEVIYDLSRPRIQEEITMNLTSEFQTVTRPLTHYVFLERLGPFPEVAPPLWTELMPLLDQLDRRQIREYLGLSGIDKTKVGEETMIYQAGVAVTHEPGRLPHGLRHRSIESGRYARFLLTGPYAHIWTAFDRIFKALGEKRTRLRPDYCIENYLNDPRVTPEDRLQTELLVPIA